MDLKTRLAGPESASDILEMAEAFHIEDGHPLVAHSQGVLLALLTGSPFGVIHLVESGGRLVGYFALCFTVSIEFGGKVVILDDLYLIPEFRGKGFGGRLMAEIEKICRNLGAIQIFLEVEKANERAYRLYQKCLFQKRERHMMSRDLNY